MNMKALEVESIPTSLLLTRFLALHLNSYTDSSLGVLVPFYEGKEEVFDKCTYNMK